MKYRLSLAKRILEDILMFPLISVGRLVALIRPLPQEYKVFYFFPFYHTGGAEKVHSMITQATGGVDCIIFFTKKSINDTFRKSFEASGCVVKDISNYTGNKWLYPLNIIYRGTISGYINRQNVKPVVFNGQCNFGYKLSPWVRKDIRQVELIHSVSNFSYIRIPFLPFITKTVMISRKKIAEHIPIYRRYNIPSNLDERINYVPNATGFSGIAAKEKRFDTISVFYSGRATLEKRSHLVVEIAKKVHAVEPRIEFVMAGDEFISYRSAETDFIYFEGNIADEKKLQAIYERCHVVLITSSTEGFPLAVIEGMMYGNAIVATAVGDIPVHVKPNENGLLFSSVKDESTIIGEGAEYILQLYRDRDLLKRMSAANIQYAQQNFGFDNFAEAYRKIIFA